MVVSNFLNAALAYVMYVLHWSTRNTYTEKAHVGVKCTDWVNLFEVVVTARF